MWVYILAAKRNGTIYAGVMNDLVRRVYEHRTHAAPSFTAEYDVTMPVWFDGHESPESVKRRSRAGRENGSWI